MTSFWKPYYELTKPRVTLLVVATTWFGFSLSNHGEASMGRLAITLLGTWLSACGASALNQWMERDYDRFMRRTQSRPLPQGRLTSQQAFIFGASLSVIGVLLLAVYVNALTAELSALTLATYLGLYTPLKRKTAISTLVGAVPGAIPPMMGCTAVHGQLTLQSWILFLILFLWQLPHFLAIAWMYRDDYRAAGFPMLPVVDQEGDWTVRVIILYCATLIPVTLIPAIVGLAGFTYFWGALTLGLAFLGYGVAMAMGRTRVMARRLLLASVIYLPILLGWLAYNRTV